MQAVRALPQQFNALAQGGGAFVHAGRQLGQLGQGRFQPGHGPAHSAQRLGKAAQRLHFLLHPAHQRKDRLSLVLALRQVGKLQLLHLAQFGCGLVQGLLLRRDGR